MTAQVGSVTTGACSVDRRVRPHSWKRKVAWSEMTPSLRALALEKLRRLAEAKVKYDGTLLAYAWPERIAPKLRYTLTARGAVVWDCQPMPKDRKCGYSIFTLPVLSFDELNEYERAMRPNENKMSYRRSVARLLPPKASRRRDTRSRLAPSQG